MASLRSCEEILYTLVIIIPNVPGLRREDWRRDAEMCSPPQLLEVLRLGSVPTTISIQILACFGLRGERKWQERKVAVVALPWHRQRNKKNPARTARGVMSAGIRAV